MHAGGDLGREREATVDWGEWAVRALVGSTSVLGDDCLVIAFKADRIARNVLDGAQQLATVAGLCELLLIVAATRARNAVRLMGRVHKTPLALGVSGM
jgi:hypothetical protein